MTKIQQPRAGNEYRTQMRRMRNARRAGPHVFVAPRQTWGKSEFAYTREMARRLRQRAVKCG